MGTLLKESLKALCGVNRWCYAVFWKTGLQNPKLLIWEESYTLPENEETEAADYIHDYNISSSNESIRLLLKKMMMDNHINIVGKGFVGRVAFTGQHQWIISDNFYMETHPSEEMKELRRQFSAGMKTVVVVPVLPHGVVQLGSFTRIAEEKGLIDGVKSMVHHLGSNVHGGGLLAENYGPKASSSRAFHPKPIVETKFNVSHLHRGGLSMPSNLGKRTNHRSASQPITGATNPPSISGRTHFTTSETSKGTLMSESELSNAHGSSYRNEAENAWNNSFLDIPLSQNELITDYSYYYPDDTYVAPPSGNDLFDVLGADFKNKLLGDCNNSTPSNASDSCIYNWDGKVLPCNKNIMASSSSSSSSSSDLHYSTATQENSASTILAQNRAEEHLLDAMIRTVPSTEMKFEELSVQKSTLKAETQTHSQCSSICGSSQLCSWTLLSDRKSCKANRSNSFSTGYSKKSEEKGKTNGKRLKPGEKPRPRPKDRQMIQDRVKELREIVPNGAKCSIDALLERTIKHMLFLKSVTKHAENLKQTVGSNTLSRGGLVSKDNLGGATWAYEVGSQSTVCPIIVEDLSQPRQMLVEMLCEERGLFLEIADVIRGMGLTILKGIMETRNNKIWARFAVEANRDVTRMEIFISLVRLLEQSAKNSIIKKT